MKHQAYSLIKPTQLHAAAISPSPSSEDSALERSSRVHSKMFANTQLTRSRASFSCDKITTLNLTI